MPDANVVVLSNRPNPLFNLMVHSLPRASKILIKAR
jgi:hypothetical protein